MYAPLLGFNHFYVNLVSGSWRVEGFGCKLVAAGGAGAICNLIMCACMYTYMQEEGGWAQALKGQFFGRRGFPEVKGVVCTEMTRQALWGGCESQITYRLYLQSLVVKW